MDPTPGIMSDYFCLDELMRDCSNSVDCPSQPPNETTQVVEPLASSDNDILPIAADSAAYFQWAALDDNLTSHSRVQTQIDNEALEMMLNAVESQGPPHTALAAIEDGEQRSATTIASDKAPASSTRRFRLGRPRRQNHSCDPCRSGKRACDLPLNVATHQERPSTACSMCNVRQIECTVTWLYRRQALNQVTTTKQARATSRTVDKGLDAQAGKGKTTVTNSLPGAGVSPPASPISIPKTSQELTRRLLSRQVRLERLALFAEIVDIPISQCLRQGSMPPQYSLGIASWDLLAQYPQMATYFEKANAWVQGCWDIDSVSSADWNTAPPHLFRVVSLLDAIFQRKNAGADSIYTTSRDTAITEAYKWAAVAQAAQLFVDRDTASREGNPPNNGAHLGYASDLARSAWCKAKDLVLRNLATVTSFRLALAMILFGQIAPSDPSSASLEHDETSAYVFFQGAHRLRKLCAGARALLMGSLTSRRGERRLQTPGFSADSTRIQLQDLPSDIKAHLLELIASIEWLVTLLNSVKISTSMENLDTLPVEDYITADDCRTANGVPLQCIGFGSWGKQAEDSILDLLKQKEQPFTALWVNGISNEIFVQSIRQLAALGVLLWRNLSHLVLLARALDPEEDSNLDAIHQRYTSTVTLIQLWRSSLGALDGTTRSHLQNLHYSLWRLIAFFCIDTDLAVFIFCEVCQSIEGRLLAQSFTPDTCPLLHELQSRRVFCKEQSLLSAQEVALIASTCRGLSRPGYQGPTGLKAHIQDICAHSSPNMMIKVFKLAAKVFASQACDDIDLSDTKRAMEMSAGLENCLQTLQVLQGVVVTFQETSH